MAAPAKASLSNTLRHSAVVRVTHWLTAIAFVALLITGVEILISHPRFYWGETGNINTAPLFRIPIPASRASVPTGYGYVLPDQNGWSRYLHFQAGWLIVLTGLVYIAFGFLSGHFRRSIIPARSDRSWRALSAVLARHLRLQAAPQEDVWSYNPLQRLTYLIVILVFFPLIVWTGLAMSPAIAAAVPSAVTIWGGQQSARTIHFFLTLVLILFFLIHIVMVSLSGFRKRVRAMITGRLATEQERQ